MSNYDHELLIGNAIVRASLATDSDGKAMYSVTEDIPQYQATLAYEQTNWIDGMGQYLMADPNAYFEGQSIDTTQDGRIILGPLITEVKESDATNLDSAPVCFYWSPTISKWLCATTGKVYLYGTAWTAATTTVGSCTQFAEFDGYIFAACGSGTAYKYSSDGTSWTNSTLTDGSAEKFFTSPNAAGTQNVLWKSIGNELKSNTSGINGGVAWSSAAYIGDNTSDITNIFLINDNLMLGKWDNLYNYDADGGVHTLMNDLRTAVSTNNFKYVATWQSAVYFSKGNGLGEITAYNTFSPISPFGDKDDVGKVGSCVGISADENYLYVAMDEGTNTHIYKGRETNTANGLVWQWCPWVYLAGSACAVIGFCQHTGTDRRLWFGYGTNTAYVPITDNPTSDSAARFASSGWLRMSYTYGSSQYWDKLFTRSLIDTKGCSTGQTVTGKYRKDTDTTATNATAAITANGVQEVDFYSNVPCKKIQFEVYLATSDSTKTPEVLMFKATGVEKPETTRIHECVYTIGSNPSNKTETLRSAFRVARTSRALIRFADLRYGDELGTSYTYVILQPGFPKEVEIIQEKGRTPELGIQVRWQEIPGSIIDDWGYYYSATEDIFQDIYDETNSALKFTAV